MTTSPRGPEGSYVWGWLPDATEPTLIGAARQREGEVDFVYAPAYLDREDAISLWPAELPLGPGWIRPPAGHQIASALRDAGPDNWGRRVILDRLHGRSRLGEEDLASDLTYLREGSSNRIGALDFQDSPREYVSRPSTVRLEDAEEAALTLESGQELSAAAAAALFSGTGVGGAQPKAFVTVGEVPYLAKFSTSADSAALPPVVAEAAAMVMARAAGIEVSDSRMARVNGRRALLMRRWDREEGGRRRMVLTAATITAALPVGMFIGSYVDLLKGLRDHPSAEDPGEDLFRRIAFNMAISNNDDHTRNHAAFWDGSSLTLTPAYDLAPGSRSGDTAQVALAYDLKGSRQMRFPALVAAAPMYGLSRRAGQGVVDQIVEAMHTSREEAAEAAQMTEAEDAALWGRQFLHRSLFYTD